MPREYPPHPLPAVLAVVVRGDEVLLVQRGRDPDRGKWGFPGGAVEVGETFTQAALRELAEETGLVAEAGEVLDVFDVMTRDAEGRTRHHYILIAVLCRWLSGEPEAADDAADARWFAIDEALSPDLPASPNLARLLRLALARG